MNKSATQVRTLDVDILSAKRLNIIISIFSLTFIIEFGIGLLYGQGHSFDIFSDFISTLIVSKNPYSFVGFGRGYFPFVFLFLWPFSLFSLQAALLISLMLFIIFFYISSYLFLGNNFSRLASTLALCSFSYVFIFLLDRANVETFVYIFIAMFMLLYLKPNKSMFLDIITAIFISFAINFKLYPGVFIILMLRDKRFRCLAFTILFSGIVFIISMKAVGGTLDGLLQNLSWFNDNYQKAVFEIVAPQNTHSLFDSIKSITLLITKDVDVTKAIILKFIGPYVLLVLILFTFIAAYVILYEKSKWRAVFLLTVAMVLFPYTSNDYTLIHMYIPLFMYIISKKDNGKLDYIFSVLFAIIFCQLSFFELIKNFNWYLGMLIRPFAILTIMLIIIIQGLKKNKFKDFKRKLMFYMHENQDYI